MTVFKTFLKVLNKNKFIIILYTVILVSFGGLNFQNNDNNMNFVANKPDVLIINNDVNEGITKNLIDYITNNSNIIEIRNDENKINDALFYREINYIIYIPEHFREDFLSGKNPQIEIKSTGDYQASLAGMILNRYLNVANVYNKTFNNEDMLIKNIKATLEKQAEVEVTAKLDTDSLTNMARYFNFASYSILAGCVYVIAIILASFRETKIEKRTIVSSTNYKKYNRELFLSNSILAVILWLLYYLLSIFLLGKAMFTMYGLFYLINSLVFTFCALALAFLISTIVNNKNAINGIVNVVALGSSFLCGAFVPMEWLPNSVIKIAHLLPTYYYIKSNDLLAKIEVFNLRTLKPIFLNIGMVVIFMIIFVIITNMLSKRKRKIG